MRMMILAALAAGTMLTAAVPAEARQGCGLGSHRGPRGRCVGNQAGRYYRNQGWWDGHRYQQHRYRQHNQWRYR